MAPFPETEIMTIKRLEVALRKMDFKLLKDGAYKLHEKYHSGHKFEYLDLLKELFMDISNNPGIPEDIKDILSPTIEDILSQQGIKADTSTSPYESLNQSRVSSLTSLSYGTAMQHRENASQGTNEQEQKQKINAFQAFGAKTPENHPHHTTMTYSQSPFSAQPFKEFSMPENTSAVNNAPEENTPARQEAAYNPQNSVPQTENPTQALAQNAVQSEEPIAEQASVITAEPEAPEKIEAKEKTIAIFYGKDNSAEKARNIAKYQELISKMEDNHSSITEILHLISEINTQSNANVSELKNILEQLNATENRVNLVTNCSSARFINLFEESNLSYSVFGGNKDAKTKLLPLFGLSNLFVCENCAQEHLNKNTDIAPLVLECPKCKSPMFPNFYAANGKRAHLNIDYYNEALVALANSSVWFIIHPLLEEKTTINLLLSALALNKNVEEIFILDKDINVRENCKNLFKNIREDLKINTQINALEDFLNSVK